MFIGNLTWQGILKLLIGVFEEMPVLTNKTLEIEFTIQENQKIEFHFQNINKEVFFTTLEKIVNNTFEMEAIGLLIFLHLGKIFEIKFNQDNQLHSFFPSEDNIQHKTSVAVDLKSDIVINYTWDNNVFQLEEKTLYRLMLAKLEQLAYINPNYKLIYKENRANNIQINTLHFANGMFELRDYYISQLKYGSAEFVFDISNDIKGYSYQIGIAYSTVWLDKSNIRTFANNDELTEGGALQNGIINGIQKAVDSILKENNIHQKTSKKMISFLLIAMASVKGNDFDFSGSTKTKLAMPKMQKAVENMVCENILNKCRNDQSTKNFIIDKFKIVE